MSVRKIVNIDESKCNGCGQCIPNCAEGALKIIDGKARLVKDIYCDGLGACLGHCHMGAITIIEREAGEFDEKAVKVSSRLRQWPVQLNLVPINAPYFERADLLITADCVPFAYANYHNDFLRDRAVVMGCPKLDDNRYYTEKLSEIIESNDLESITVLKMEVPCCGGFAVAAKSARDMAGSDIPVKVLTIGIEGEVLKREYI